MTNKKILILYGSVGLGHKSLAENMAYTLQQSGCQVKLVDALLEQKNWLTKLGTIIYNFFISNLPFVWRFLYTNTWLAKKLSPFRLLVAKKNSDKIQIVVEGFMPDLIITTHSNASAIIAYLKKQGIYKGLFAVAFSDFHFHPFWLYNEADFYLANINEQKEEMLELGISQNKIFVCGVSLSQQNIPDKLSIKNKLNIFSNNKIILITGGSNGLGLNNSLIENLSKQNNVTTIIACGNNDNLQKKLQKIYKNIPAIKILGFYKPMEELYAIADIFVSKAGGLSVAEALKYNLPILISYVLPGQEELNFDFLLEQGLVMPEPINLEEEILEELSTNNFSKVLKNNSKVQEVLYGQINLKEAILKMFLPID